MATRLLRRLSDWKEPYTLKHNHTPIRREALDAALGALKEEQLVASSESIDDLTFYRAKSSREAPEGYKGLVGIEEVLAVSPGIREAIARGDNPRALEARAAKEGMLTLVADASYKSARGQTSLEEAARI